MEIEFPIAVTHRTFSTTYYLDALVADGGAFEFKAVEELAPSHRRRELHAHTRFIGNISSRW